MTLVFDENNVTLEDMLNIERGRTFDQQIQFLARFVVDETGAPVGRKDALTYAAHLTIPQARAAMRDFWLYMGRAREGAVNPPNAAS